MTRVKVVILCLLCVTYLTATTDGAGTDAGGYEVIANAFGFAIDIPGAPDASKNIREIHIDELNIDAREMTTGHDVEYRLYAPGHAHWGSASFTSACTLGASKELRQWFNEAARGKNIRKNITVTLFKSDKTPGRGYQLIDAFPTAFKPCNPLTGNATQTIQVTMQRIEFAARPEVPPPSVLQPVASTTLLTEPQPSNALPEFFRVMLHDAGVVVSVDDAWEIANGGAPSHEEPPLMLGKIDVNDPTLDVSPHATCTDLRLRGPMTAGRAELARWINETTVGKPSRRQLTIVAGGDLYVFTDAILTGYVFPRMSVTNTTGNVMEEVRIKPIRCELK